MHRIDNSSAVAIQPALRGLGTPGFFQEGNLALGLLATIVDEDWANSVQEEIANAIIDSGLVLDKANQRQLSAAIILQITTRIAAEAALRGTADSNEAALRLAADVAEITARNVAIAAEATARSNGDIAVENWVSSYFLLASQITGGAIPSYFWQKFPDGLMIQGGVAYQNDQTWIAYPIAFSWATITAIVCEGNADGWGDSTLGSCGVSRVRNDGFVFRARYVENGGVVRGTNGSPMTFDWFAVGL